MNLIRIRIPTLKQQQYLYLILPTIYVKYTDLCNDMKVINIYIYIYKKSASRFSRGTVLNTLKQSRINIMRGKKDVTTFPDKPVS